MSTRHPRLVVSRCPRAADGRPYVIGSSRAGKPASYRIRPRLLHGKAIEAGCRRARADARRRYMIRPFRQITPGHRLRGACLGPLHFRRNPLPSSR
ncbi:hypothetical protein EVAR_39511_1 [Eumeta japonica]|uniref:Uncharacterized protein n=1 Tax=Eumeta variegata TaxID=151549 RepID=A0A4C1W0X0_EUMVA|nr:hypothetical protein EVAR_39511_1 [Eumeta japonica]